MSEGNGKPLIITPDMITGKNQPLIMCQVLNRDKVAKDAMKELHREYLYMKYEIAFIQSPLGWIPVDQDGSHPKSHALEDDFKIEIIICDQRSEKPVASCPVQIRDLLKLCDHTMPIAEFVSNQDGGERKWVDLLVTMYSTGMNTRPDETYRRQLNAQNMILGGSHPFDRSKL